MKKQKFIIGQKELEDLYELTKLVDNMPVTVLMIKKLFKRVLFLEALTETVKDQFLSPESSLLTLDQKRKFFEIWNNKIHEVWNKENQLLHDFPVNLIPPQT